MDTKGKVRRVYVCSNVGLDYFFFLCKTLATEEFEIIPVYLLSEQKYRQVSKGNKLVKAWFRFQTYLIYPIMLCFKALFANSGSIFIVTSNTFYSPLVLSILLRFRQITVIHLLYDLFPDALEVAGAIAVNSRMSKVVGNLTRWNQQFCAGTVYLGDFLKQHAELRWGKAKKSATIHISTDLSLYDHNFNETISTEKIIIHYGGQLGYLHDANSIIECLKDILSSDLADKVEFNFYVSGAQVAYLEKALKGVPVNIISAIPSSQWRKDIREFHIGLVSLSPGGASVCFPSKTYGMMAGGMAVMAICPQWSDLAGLIREVDGGWIINNSDYENISEIPADDYLNAINRHRAMADIKSQFQQAVREAVQQRDILLRKRQNAFNGVRKYHNIDVLRNQWSEFITQLD